MLVSLNVAAVVSAFAWSYLSHRYNDALGAGSSGAVTYWDNALTLGCAATLLLWLAAIVYSFWSAFSGAGKPIAGRVFWCVLSLAAPPLAFLLT